MAPQAIPAILQNVKEHLLFAYGTTIFNIASKAAGKDVTEYMSIHDAGVKTDLINYWQPPLRLRTPASRRCSLKSCQSSRTHKRYSSSSSTAADGSERGCSEQGHCG